MYTILVAEDDDGIREELTLLLSANGYKVTYEPPCDLALLDVNMPVENGFEYCGRLRKSSNVCIMQNEVCPKEKILDALWNSSLYIDENTLYVNINRLRSKLSDIGCRNFIKTVRGVGYRL